MSDIAIRVENLSKCYHIYDTPRDRLLQMLAWGRRQYFREFWALKDISIEIRKGETFGIIGRNGSGKSTLLQLICGTLNPTSGSIYTNGRIAALLELGSGFNADFTGRENIYLNGSVLGLTQEEIEARLDDILAFADIGDFIDQPVKTYSSGMFVRLAFAIQVNVNPEILIVDEALSVGDFFFAQKCFARMRRMREDGLTLLFVSHDMGTVRDLCQNSLYLAKGKSVFLGDSQEAIRSYLSEGTVSVPVESTQEPSEENDFVVEPEVLLEEAMQVALWKRDQASITDENRLLAVVVRDESGNPVDVIRMGSKVVIQVFLRANFDDRGHVSIAIKNKYDQIVCSTGTYLMGKVPIRASAQPCHLIEFEIDWMLEAGLYSLIVAFGVPVAPNQGEILDKTDWVGPLETRWKYEVEKAPFLGMFGLPVACRQY